MKKVILIIAALMTVIVSQSLFAEPPQLSDKWVSENVQAINTVLPDKEDLHFLKQEIGDKRIVFLGEATHDDGATFEVRTKIFEFLMEEMDFEVILFEAGMFDVMQANKEFQKSGKAESIRKSLWRFWRTQQWQSIYSYIEQRKAEGHNMEFAGFEAKFSSAYGFNNNNYSRFWATVFEEKNPEIWNNENYKNYMAVWQDIERGYQRSGIRGVLAMVRYKMRDREKEQFRNLSIWMADELTKMEENTLAQMLRSNDESIIAFSDTRLWKLIFNKKSIIPVNNRRDELMADNLQHLLSEVYPNKKVIVIGATYHFVRNNQSIDPIKIMGIPVHESVIAGDLIYKQFANEIYTVGFTSYDGEYGWPREGKKGRAVTPLGANSLEYQLANRGIE